MKRIINVYILNEELKLGTKSWKISKKNKNIVRIHLEIPLIPNQRSHSGTCASVKSFMCFVIL